MMGLNDLLQKKWAVLIAWQICALLVCSYSTFCTVIGNHYEAAIPFFMVALAYTLLLICSIWKVPKAKNKWYGYIGVALLTIAGDYCGVQAYNHTSMSTALLLCTTIVFWVAPLAFIFLKRKMTIWQFLAILLGLGGTAMIVVSDGTEGEGWKGDLLALGSAICYAILTLTQEYLVHSDSVHLYFFRFSITACPLAWILAGAVDHKQIRDYNWDLRAGLLYVGYAISLVLYVVCANYIMQFSDATTMNISLLTANFYALFICILFMGQKPTWFYLIGFLCIPIAITIYSLFGPKEEQQQEPELEETKDLEEQKLLDEEEGVDEEKLLQETKEFEEEKKAEEGQALEEQKLLAEGQDLERPKDSCEPNGIEDQVEQKEFGNVQA